MSDVDDDGIQEGLAESEGDPRVLLALNLVLSALFGWVVVWGLAFIDLATFDAVNVATATIIVFALTYLVVNT